MRSSEGILFESNWVRRQKRGSAGSCPYTMASKTPSFHLFLTSEQARLKQFPFYLFPRSNRVQDRSQRGDFTAFLLRATSIPKTQTPWDVPASDSQFCSLAHCVLTDSIQYNELDSHLLRHISTRQFRYCNLIQFHY